MIVAILSLLSKGIAVVLKKLDAQNRVANVHLSEYKITKSAILKALYILEMYDKYDDMPNETTTDIKRRNALKHKIEKHRKNFRKLLARE